MQPGSTLKRSISLPLLTLYGLGTIIGAGIYVLVGEIAGHAGVFAPVAFLVAAVVAALTGVTYGELAARLPVSAGEAVYVNTAFQRKWLSTMTGWAVVLTGVVSAAALVNGFSGYFLVFVQVPEWWVVVALAVLLGGVAAWGIKESAWIAASITVLSVLGLIWVLVVAFSDIDFASFELDDFLPPLNKSAWSGIFLGGFLAFYAFVGFEDMVNVAEEVHHPERTIPRAIFIALGLSTLLYALVAFAAVATLPINELQNSRAPLVDMMSAQGEGAEKGIAVLSLLSVVNGALVQVIMASRVLYGMARQDMAPRRLANVNPVTRTPLLATGVTVLVVLALALWLPIATLAQVTSLVVLLVFAVMHLSLLRLKKRNPQPDGVNVVHPVWPAIGLLLSLGLILLRGLSL
jgi:APA family basic amino acid/polyamine antiporter